MDLRRREFMSGAAAVGAATAGVVSATAPAAAQGAPTEAPRRLRRIATEEAWAIPEQREALAMIAHSNWPNLDAQVISPNIASEPGQISLDLLDTKRRLEQMDRLGIDMQVLSLTSPGVQLFDTELAVSLAALANDRMADVIRSAPTRFAGLASFAPQDPARAAKEMERAVTKLGLNGFVVNSHTNNEYLDEPKYWPILEAAEALDRPIYIHPRCPSDGMAAPFRGNMLQSAIWGYAVETGTHAVRLMLSEVFDRFPKLQIVLGHMGENIPFHLWRTDHWHGRRPGTYPSDLKPSEIMKRNFMITNSGVEHGPALRYAIEVLGADRIMWAIDYPYQDMSPSVEFINNVDISEDVRAQILHRNAERVFHIPA